MYNFSFLLPFLNQNVTIFTCWICSLLQSSGIVLLTRHLSPNTADFAFISPGRHWCICEAWNLFTLKNLSQLKCACILSSATLNMQWASPTFSLRVCYGPTPLLCLYEQFLAASFNRTALKCCFFMNFKNLHQGQWNSQAEMRIDPKPRVGGGNYHLKPLSAAAKRFKWNGNG